MYSQKLIDSSVLLERESDIKFQSIYSTANELDEVSQLIYLDLVVDELDFVVTDGDKMRLLAAPEGS